VIGDEPENTRKDPEFSEEALPWGEGKEGTRCRRAASIVMCQSLCALRLSQLESRMRENRTSGLMSGDGKRSHGKSD